MPVRVAQRPPGGILHTGVSVAPSSLSGPGSSGRCLGGPAPAGSPPLPPSLGLGGGASGVNTNAPNPLQAMASAAASLTQLNNMANGPLPPLGSGPSGLPNLPPPQPATTPTHGGPPTPHQGVSGPHLNGASPSPHPMPPHGMMSGSPHPSHTHMGGGGPSPHPHHPGPHMVGSPHHPGPHMGPGGMMGPSMQPQGGPGMCAPGPAGPMGPHPHPQGPGVPGQPHMHNDPFYCSPFGSPYYRSLPVPRRHTPYFNHGQPDYRLYELNKRLQQRTEESDNLWWDAFATEFFEDDATLTLAFCLEDGPKRYSIGRTLIPRYFRSIFEGGVTELYYNMKHPKESFHNTSITLDCDHCVMVTHHAKPMFTKVCTEGRLILEFTFDDLMRIKSWHMTVRQHREFVPRSVVGMHSTQQDPALLEQISKNITRQGITNSTLNYLRLCVILEPMQELMSRHKAYALSPRDCLKTTLFQKWQRMVAPPGKRESQRPASKRRKRKGSTSGPGNNAPPAPSNKKRSPGPNFSLASQDVMVVGEPSLMGGEFGDEDERLITRLENTQYDAANSLDPHSHDNSGGPPPHPHQFHSEPTPGNSWPPDRGPGPPQGGPGSQVVQGSQGGQGAGIQGSQDASQQQQDKKSPAVSQ
ncbi:LIM domain-binding protein 2 isoform X3 [Belonocnema kinseyi]|uniref:LIM domain-binding protein 2 isoform X3 n=1 Tax=Belonocnema kinseyi TaxID=2817044 RepID=UPI00143CC2BB|nr:LIM domain-binding protein 2 isoform X3 [Belonocnema kinseyi]